jgi:hypothetical protein
MCARGPFLLQPTRRRQRRRQVSKDRWQFPLRRCPFPPLSRSLFSSSGLLLLPPSFPFLTSAKDEDEDEESFSLWGQLAGGGKGAACHGSFDCKMLPGTLEVKGVERASWLSTVHPFEIEHGTFRGQFEG